MSKAVATVHIDNEHVRVTEWAFEPGAAAGWHRHGFGYVITPKRASSPRRAAPDVCAGKMPALPGDPEPVRTARPG